MKKLGRFRCNDKPVAGRPPCSIQPGSQPTHDNEEPDQCPDYEHMQSLHEDDGWAWAEDDADPKLLHLFRSRGRPTTDKSNSKPLSEQLAAVNAANKKFWGESA